jgi:hypothetical protein
VRLLLDISIRLLKSLSFGFEDGLVAVVIGEFDLDGTVVEQFGGIVAGDLVHLVEPSQVKPTDNRLYSMSRPAWRTPKAISPRPWSVIVRVASPQRSKMIAIPNAGLDDPPTADELAVRWHAHARVASDFGQPRQVVGRSREGEVQTDSVNLVFS